jgi:hypothetical protein
MHCSCVSITANKTRRAELCQHLFFTIIYWRKSGHHPQDGVAILNRWAKPPTAFSIDFPSLRAYRSGHPAGRQSQTGAAFRYGLR